jgi:hypothetical protein
LVKKRKIGRENYFCKTYVGFVKKKIPGHDSKHLGHLVRPVQLFLDQGFLIKGQLFSANPRSGAGF